jgi:hypothetical protein
MEKYMHDGDEKKEEKHNKNDHDDTKEEKIGGNIVKHSSTSGSSEDVSNSTSNSDPSSSNNNNNRPTMAPVGGLYAPTDAQFTDLAHQEISNWMDGGPKEEVTNTSSQQQQEQEEQMQQDGDHEDHVVPQTMQEGKNQDENTVTDLAHQEIGNWMDDGPDSNNTSTSYDDQEPSEMEIKVPMTEEEEEKIDEDIEEWEEEHGKIPMDDTNNNGEDGEGGDSMYIPQTEEEEKEINDEIEEWKEENGKGIDLVDKDEDDDENNSTEPPETEVPAPTPLDPLVVSPSWTPPKITPKHTLATGHPTMAPVVPAPVPAPVPSALDTPTSIIPAATNTNTDNISNTSDKTTSTTFMVAVSVPFIIIVCCLLKFCFGKSKEQDTGRGKYRAIDNAFSDNVFSEDFSDDEDDLENDSSWGESNGKRVLEMSKIRRRNGDADLDLQEMNG